MQASHDLHPTKEDKNTDFRSPDLHPTKQDKKY
jgi:hypothetical protein